MLKFINDLIRRNGHKSDLIDYNIHIDYLYI